MTYSREADRQQDSGDSFAFPPLSVPLDGALAVEDALDLSNAQALRYATDLAKIRKEAKQGKQELAEANRQLRRYAVDLRTTVRDLRSANRDLEEAYFDTVRRLVIAAEYKDRETGSHISRISKYTGLLARKLGLERAEAQALEYASPMHDIGKIGIPDRILLKPDRLTAPEFELMKCHTTIGSNILAGSKATVLQLAHEIALNHHERWNGKGYPFGISGLDIPVSARIVSLVDTFDALTSKRPYKEAFPVDFALDVITKEKGRHFDPALVEVFFGCIDEVRRIRDGGSDTVEGATGSFRPVTG